MKILFLFALLLMTTPLKAQEFAPYMDGVPVMPQFFISPDDIMVFDKPQGRVAEITLWCQENCPDTQLITAFYDESLEKLGWGKTPQGQYTRHETSLAIEISNDTPNSETIIVLRTNG